MPVGVTATLYVSPDGNAFTFDPDYYAYPHPEVLKACTIQIQHISSGVYTLTKNWEKTPKIVHVFSEAPAGTDTSLVFDVTGFDIVTGDLLIAFIGIDASFSALTPPGTFAEPGALAATAQGTCQAMIATATEAAAASLTWSWTTTQERGGALLVIRDHDGANWMNAAEDATGTTAAPIAPAVTTTANNCLVLRGFVADDDDTPYAQNDSALTITQRFSIAVASLGPGVFGGDHIQLFAGDSATFTFSQALSEEWGAFTVAIQ